MGSTFTGGYQSSRHQIRHVAEVGTIRAVLMGSDQTDIVTSIARWRHVVLSSLRGRGRTRDEKVADAHHHVDFRCRICDSLFQWAFGKHRSPLSGPPVPFGPLSPLRIRRQEPSRWTFRNGTQCPNDFRRARIAAWMRKSGRQGKN